MSDQDAGVNLVDLLSSGGGDGAGVAAAEPASAEVVATDPEVITPPAAPDPAPVPAPGPAPVPASPADSDLADVLAEIDGLEKQIADEGDPEAEHAELRKLRDAGDAARREAIQAATTAWNELEQQLTDRQNAVHAKRTRIYQLGETVKKLQKRAARLSAR